MGVTIDLAWLLVTWYHDMYEIFIPQKDDFLGILLHYIGFLL